MPIRNSTILGCLVLASLTGHAQDPAPTGGVASALMRTEVFATLDGRPVTDLASTDVQLLEDGVEQSLEDWTLVHPRSDTGTGVSVVLFVDTLHTPVEADAALRLALGRALEAGLVAADRVALTTPERVATELSFASVREAVSSVAQPQWAWARQNPLDGPDPKEALYDSCFAQERGGADVAAELTARRRERMTLDALDDLVGQLERQATGRTVVLLVSEGWRLFGEKSELGRPQRARGGVETPFGRIGGGRRPDTPTVAGVSRVECEADLRAFARLDHSQRVRRLSEAANRALVSVVSVSAAGLGRAARAAASAEAVRAAEAGLDSLRFLADNTDGAAVVAAGTPRDLAAQLTAEGTPYYLARFRSANGKLDGRFRALSVRTTRPGVRLRVRRGYRGLTADELLSDRSARPSRQGVRADPAASRPSAPPPFSIRSAAWAHEGDAGAFWVIGELDARLRRELVWSAAATAQVTVVTADGRTVFTRSIDLPPADNSFSFRVPEQGEMPGGDYAVRVRVAPEGDPRVELSDTTRVALGRAPRGLSEPLVWRRGVSTGPRFVQTSASRFQRRDRVRVEFATRADGQASGRLVDRAGEPLQVPVSTSVRPDGADGGLRWVVADLTLAPLAPGEYEIEVEMTGGLRGTYSFLLTP